MSVWKCVCKCFEGGPINFGWCNCVNTHNCSCWENNFLKFGISLMVWGGVEKWSSLCRRTFRTHLDCSAPLTCWRDFHIWWPYWAVISSFFQCHAMKTKPIGLKFAMCFPSHPLFTMLAVQVSFIAVEGLEGIGNLTFWPSLVDRRFIDRLSQIIFFVSLNWINQLVFFTLLSKFI